MFLRCISYLHGNIFLVLLMSFACLAGNLNATNFYPDVMGNNVWFRGISENTKTVGDPEPLYGSPTVLGDTLDFNPNNFDFVASSNNLLVDTTDGALSLMIEAKPGHTLDLISIEESGLVNLFTLSGDPFASVTGLVELTINEVDGVSITPINLAGIIPTFSPSGGDFQHSVDATSPQFSSAWQGATSIDLVSELTSQQIIFDHGVTKVSLKIDNFLLAAAGGEGSLASIDKKEFFVSTTTGDFNGIPEPSTLGLATIAMISSLQVLRRKRLDTH